MLNEVPPGTMIFINVNILVYHFCGILTECGEFLKRCASEELLGLTSTMILLETCHRLMLIEAANRIGRQKNRVSYLREHPKIVREATAYRTSVKIAIIGMRLRIVDVRGEDVLRAVDVQEREGFLTNDSLCIGLLEREGICNIATNDTDFERMKNLGVWMPTDI